MRRTQDDAARLEAALERIALARARRPATAPEVQSAELAVRLDALIAELRGLLKKDLPE